MTIIIIFLALVLDRLIGYKPELHHMGWFDIYRNRMTEYLPAVLQTGTLGVIVLALPPVLLVLGIQYVLSGWTYGVWELIFAVVVLYYSLDAAELNMHIEAYLDARDKDEPQRASKEAATLAGGSGLNKRYAESTAVTMSILYRSVVDIFCVLFWFVLLGPAGAILYKIVSYLLRLAKEPELPDLTAAAERVWGLLGWLPARLVALSYFLAGSFDDALAGWKVGHTISWEFSKTNCLVVTLTGCGAIRHEVDDAVDSKPTHGNDDLEWVHTARHLVFRSIIVWYALIAILTLTTSWFV